MKKIIILIILLALSYIQFIVQAQTQFQTVLLDTVYNIKPELAVLETTNGNYMVCTSIYSDDGFKSDFLITRFDSKGTKIWSKILSSPTRDSRPDIIEISDDQFIFSGWVAQNSGGIDDWYIAKLDQNGDVLNEVFIGGSGDDQCHGLLRGDNNEFYAYGVAFGFNRTLVKMNDEMEILWSKVYGTTGRDEPLTFIKTSDGHLISCGVYREDDQVVIKFDTKGNVLWAKTFGGTGQEIGYDITETTDSCYLVIGTTDSFGAGSFDILVSKLSITGEFIWSKAYGNTGEDRASSIVKDLSGTYFISGYSNSFGNGSFDVFLIEIDEDGNLISAHSYGGENDEMEGPGYLTNDGGVIMASSSDSYGSGTSDLLLIKTDSTGGGCCGNTVNDILITDAMPTITELQYTTTSNITFTSHSITLQTYPYDTEIQCFDSYQISGPDIVNAFDTNVRYSLNPEVIIPGITWILPEGAYISQNFSDTAVLVNFSSQSGYIYLFKESGCDAGYVDSLYVEIMELVIHQHPSDQILCKGESTILTVQAFSPDPPVSYQWLKNGEFMPGETDDTLVLNNVNLTHSGYYRCLAYDNSSSDISKPAYVEVIEVAPTEIMGHTEVELFQWATYSILYHPDHIYHFWVNGGNIIDSTVNSITVHWIATGYGFIYLLETGESGCQGDTVILSVKIQSLGIDPLAVVSRQSLVTVYPNPTNGISDFRFQIADFGSVALKIYDLHGREVATVVDREFPAGEHTVSFDASGLPAGVYVYQKTEDRRKKTEVGKLIKL
jgi:hypothetical protein